MSAQPDTNDADDAPVAQLLNEIRGRGLLDTTEARFERDGERVEGEVPMPERASGDLLRYVAKTARTQGWAVWPEGWQPGTVTVARGPDVEPYRDSTLALHDREGSRMERECRRSGGDPLANGSRVRVTVMGETQEGRLAEAGELEAGQEVYVQYRDTRRTGGYSYSANGQEFYALVDSVGEERVELRGKGHLDRTDEYEGRATWHTEDGERKAVKHLAALEEGE